MARHATACHGKVEGAESTVLSRTTATAGGNQPREECEKRVAVGSIWVWIPLLNNPCACNTRLPPNHNIRIHIHIQCATSVGSVTMDLDSSAVTMLPWSMSGPVDVAQPLIHRQRGGRRPVASVYATTLHRPTPLCGAANTNVQRCSRESLARIHCRKCARLQTNKRYHRDQPSKHGLLAAIPLLQHATSRWDILLLSSQRTVQPALQPFFSQPGSQPGSQPARQPLPAHQPMSPTISHVGNDGDVVSDWPSNRRLIPCLVD